ncbi:MAG TPA: hypothetical protein DDZ76_09140, partial [Xanthomonadales bacterium]|nr:hypothetical protein [Xanthomonadales bacterium]
MRIAEFGTVGVTSMTIDAQDRLFVLTSDNKVHRVLPDGTRSLHAQLPTDQQGFGITRDGVGGVYVQQRGNRIFYITPEREVRLLDLRGATFEYEGVNIAGDCGESMFMTPMSLPGTSQGGEEHSIVQLVGRTGELGTVLNGKLIGQDLLDMDFIVYDRFGSRLLIMSESNGLKLFSVPITCGAIDLDLHLVFPADQPMVATEPLASSVFVRGDGDV